jgi:uncharacterized membrane protein YbhN (UPF0104 family)
MKRLITLVLAIAIIIGIAWLVDFGQLYAVLSAMPKSVLLLLVTIFVAGSILKALRWAYYLRAAQLDIRWRDGLTSYLAGMTAAPIPGGSWLAVRLVKEHNDEASVRRAAAALFVSFVGDAVAVSAVALTVFAVTGQRAGFYLIPAASLSFAVLLITMGRSEATWRQVGRVFSRFRLTRRWLPQEEDIHQRVAVLMRPRVLAGGVAFSLATTLTSALFLMVLINALTFRGANYLESLFVLAGAEATGTLIPSPSGIGVTDSSIAGLLTTLAIGLRRATYVALTVRSLDLTMKILLGAYVLLVRYHQLLIGEIRWKRRSSRTPDPVPAGWVTHVLAPSQPSPPVSAPDPRPVESLTAGD